MRVNNALDDIAGNICHALIRGPDPNNDARSIIRFEDGTEVGWCTLKPMLPVPDSSA